MNVITLDFETYYDDDYTLRKLTTEAYVRDPRFEVLGCGIKVNDSHPTWFTAEECRLLFLDCPAPAILCHHAQFDGLILSHHYGIKPALWLDTLSMARLVVGNHLSVSLDSLASHYGLGSKRIDYKSFKNRRWAELEPAAQQALADGCLHDVELTWRLFNILMQGFPDEELQTIDTTVRMFVEPILQGDVDLLAKVWMDEERRKRTDLAELGVDSGSLQSSDTFADLLRSEGIEPETKSSPSDPAKRIYAFAKTDDFMKELIEDDGRAGALARARLGVRSTITQTRAERLGFMASRGPLPVYLRYSGAHTTRWAGGDSLNWQNFPRGSSIRKSIKAPEGYSLIVLDLSQIECRVLNTLAGEWDVVEAFRTDRDLYSEGASRFYGRAITRADKHERHLGKVLELGCGYGMGAAKLQATCRLGALGGPPIILDDAQSHAAIGAYRGSHSNVVAYWGQAGRHISYLASWPVAPDYPPMQWGPMWLKEGRIYLPNGAWLNYTTLERYDDPAQGGYWRIKTRQGWTKLYGGKLVENVVQALARVILSQAMLRIVNKGYKIATTTHDEVVVVVKTDDAQRAFDECKAEMERQVAWLPQLPVKAEGGISARYDK